MIPYVVICTHLIWPRNLKDFDLGRFIFQMNSCMHPWEEQISCLLSFVAVLTPATGLVFLLRWIETYRIVLGFHHY